MTHPTPPTRAEVEAGAKATEKFLREHPLIWMVRDNDELPHLSRSAGKQFARAVIRAAARVRGK